MKVQIFNALYPPKIFGGAEKSVALLAEGLSNSGHSVEVVTLTDDNKSEEIINGVNVIRFPLPNIYWPYGEMKSRRNIQKLLWHVLDCWNPVIYRKAFLAMKDFKPDVVHTNNIRGFSVSVWAAARSLGIPTVHTLRDYSLVCSKGGMFSGNKNCEQRCVACKVLTENKKKSSGLVDFVVSNSAFTLSAHKKEGFFHGIPSDVIFNIGGKNSNQEIKKISNTEKNQVNFGYIARIEKMKGIEDLLEAFSLINSEFISLYIAGQGESKYVEWLKNKYNSPNIKWLGFTSEKSFYSNIDVAVVPSVWNEPLPRGLIEAFNNGKSAICSEAGGNLEVAELGACWASYPVGDINSLAKIISAVLNNPDKWVSGGGYASVHAEEVFSEKYVVEKYLRAYNAAISRNV